LFFLKYKNEKIAADLVAELGWLPLPACQPALAGLLAELPPGPAAALACERRSSPRALETGAAQASTCSTAAAAGCVPECWQPPRLLAECLARTGARAQAPWRLQL